VNDPLRGGAQIRWAQQCTVLLALFLDMLAVAAIGAPPAAEKEAVQKAAVKSRAVRDWPATQVGRLMREIDELQVGGKLGEDAWARKLKQVIDVGPDAVPELIAALDATSVEDRLMLRTLPYLLRGIGDRRATPALIRAIPKCFGKDGSDMGYRSADPVLADFLAKNDAGRFHYGDSMRDRQGYGCGRPVREVCETLHEWTKVDQGWLEINFIHDDESTARQRWLKQRLYADCAQRWSDWWSVHWKELIDDPQYSVVGLKIESPAEVPSPMLDLSRTLTRVTGVSNCYSEPFTNRTARDVFLDLDTGRSSGLPAGWKDKPDDELAQGEEQLAAWGRKHGFELMGVERVVDGQTRLLIRPLQGDFWEIPESGTEAGFTSQRLIDQGRWSGDQLTHVEPATRAADPDAPACFFFVTTEGTPGILRMGVQVKEPTPNLRGPVPQNAELQPVGQRRGRRHSRDVLVPVE